MAWWISLDRLSAEERPLIGTWDFGDKSGTAASRMRSWRCAFSHPGRDGTLSLDEWLAPWLVRNGAVMFVGESSAVGRTGLEKLARLGRREGRG